MISLLGFLDSSRKYKHSIPFFGFTKFYKVMIWSGPITCDEIDKRMTAWFGSGLWWDLARRGDYCHRGNPPTSPQWAEHNFKIQTNKIKNIEHWLLCWTLFIITFLLITPLYVVNCPHKLFKTDCLLMTVNWVLWSYRMSSLEQIDRMLLGELLLLPLPHLLPLLLLHHQPSCFLQLKKLLKVWWMTLDHRCLSLCLKQRC